MIKKKAFTLIELMVSMALFMIVVTICVGAFVSASNVRALAQTQQESQQKLRIAIEMLNKYGRQADRVIIAKVAYSPSSAEFYYGEPVNQAIKFTIKAPSLLLNYGKLYYQECVSISATTGFCNINGWGSELDLLSGSVRLDLSASYLSISADSYVPILEVKLNGETKYNDNVSNPFYQDAKFSLETNVPLENLK